MTETLSPGEFEHAGMTLLQGVPQDSGLFDPEYDGPLTDDWRRIGASRIYTFTAKNQKMELFGKGYAQRSREYAKRYFSALQALGQQGLESPVLLPTHIYESNLGVALLYPLGIDQGLSRLDTFHPIEDRAKFRQVAKTYNLTLLRPHHNVSAIRIGEITYTTDVFDDSNPFEGYTG